MVARHLLLAVICTVPALAASFDRRTSNLRNPGAPSEQLNVQDELEEDEEEHEVDIDKEHEVAIEDVDHAIEQEHEEEANPSKTDGRKSESQRRVEALEAALGAANRENKALEAALAATEQQNKAYEALEPGGEAASSRQRLRGSDASMSEGSPLVPRAQQNLRAGATTSKDHDAAARAEYLGDADELPFNASAVEFEESEMEKTLTDLMLSGAKLSGSGLGKSVRHIAKLIRKNMIPKVKAAHKANQKHLDKLADEMMECGRSKDTLFVHADKSKAMYLKFSPMHKSCRAAEASKASEWNSCANDMRDKKRISDLKCKEFGMNAKKYGDQQANGQIVKKGGSEGTEGYITRITATICGKYPPAGQGGGGKGGFLDHYLKTKAECVKATKELNALNKRCSTTEKEYSAKKAECNGIQDQMDSAACKRATDVKDACESYAGCYFDKKKAYDAAVKMVKVEEKDRKSEWRGLKRMGCLVKAFGNGKVSAFEFKKCRKKKYSVDHLEIEYTKVPELVSCVVPNLYPNTAAYKLAEIAPLPALAKGKRDATKCTGVVEISTTPRAGSPTTCKCARVALNGPFSAGPLVKCSNCHDIRKSRDTNSCPDGTKLFSPRSARDWKTVLSSVGKLQDPHFIVDVTRPQNGCGDCTDKAMHSGPGGQASWRTSDGSPWWLREEPYDEPNGNYYANCYLALSKPWDENQLKFDDGNCKFHSKSYYCQRKEVMLTPKDGSPASCKCEQVVLTGPYSAGALIECTGCLPVKKSTQKNSCPVGTKLFSPASKSDWKTFITSARSLRSPNFIIDITRPQNGCGGCTRSAMNFDDPQQKTWRTADGSPWWLQATKASEPNGDYTANCYLDLGTMPANENSITFNDHNCAYSSNSYYCQPVKKKKQKK